MWQFSSRYGQYSIDSQVLLLFHRIIFFVVSQAVSLLRRTGKEPFNDLTIICHHHEIQIENTHQ